MARKTVFGSIRSGLPTALSSASGTKRASFMQFQMSRFSTTGGTKRTLAPASTKRGYAKLQNVSSSSYSSCSQSQQVATSRKQASRKREEGVPSNPIRGSQSSFDPVKLDVPAKSQLPQVLKSKSKLRRLIDRLRESYKKLRLAARQSNLQFADLFAGNQMLMHVTAAPVSRRCSKAMKHYPSAWQWASTTSEV